MSTFDIALRPLPPYDFGNQPNRRAALAILRSVAREHQCSFDSREEAEAALPDLERETGLPLYVAETMDL